MPRFESWWGDPRLDPAPARIRRLAASREAVLAALEGIDEESFYRLVPGGLNDWSILSTLENIALHDHEHAAQIRDILSRSA